MMQTARNCIFIILLLVSVLGAIVYPSKNDGSLKAINTYVSNTLVKEMKISPEELGFQHIIMFPSKTELYDKLGE